MTIKGLPQSKRGPRWHKRHAKKLAKDKARHKAGRHNHGAWSPDLAKAESQYKDAKARESNHRRGGRHQRSLVKRLWSKFISFLIRIKNYAKHNTKKDQSK